MPIADSALSFKIHGMDCAEEVTVLRRELAPVVGGEDHLAFDILTGKMSVAGAAQADLSEKIQAAVARTGMRAEVWRDEPSKEAQGFWGRRGRIILTLASGGFGLLGFLFHVWAAGGIGAALGSEGMGLSHHVPHVSQLLYGLGILAGIWAILPKAWYALRQFHPDMNLLMVVAVVGAVAIGEWFEAATVAFLFSLSLALESWSVARARRAIAALMELAPTVVRVLRNDGREELLSPETVVVGLTFVVRPGERVPLDGTVLRGTGSINQAPITGESVPVSKKPGDTVFAGTINGDAALEVQSTKMAGDTTLAHIIRLVGEAQARRAPSEQWVEKFARVYTPLVMVLALAILVIPPLLLGGAWGDWVYRALVLLVIACPCALVISTPVSIVAALAAAARHGVLVKGGRFIEAPAHLRAIAFDKTGTLTAGKLSVTVIEALDGHSETELLERAASLEARSGHPIARAILDHARQRGVAVQPADDFQVLQGKGAVGQFDGRQFWLGSHRYLEERQQETEEVHRRLESLAQSGRTVVVVGNDHHVCGYIALADAVRENARSALDKLRQAGIKDIVMLTGDNRATAEAIARQAGVDEVRAELLPSDKVTAVEELVRKYEQVAMVGDGINDAPALARASVGIAMGAAGSDAAIETADIALMSDDLSKLPWLIHHSRRTLAIIRQNIGFSLTVKAVFVILTIAGHASLWAAIAADMGASLLVIFNGLRLLTASDT